MSSTGVLTPGIFAATSCNPLNPDVSLSGNLAILFILPKALLISIGFPNVHISSKCCPASIGVAVLRAFPPGPGIDVL